MQILRQARAIGADACFSGGGGDDVFCYLRTVLPAIDRLRIEGFRAMLETTGDIARMNHANIWDALLKVARRAIRGARRAKSDSLFLGRRALDIGSGDAAGAEGADRPGKARADEHQSAL